jgi:hypothetical protein
VAQIERDEEKRQLTRRAEGTSLEFLLIEAARQGGEEFFDNAARLYAADWENVVFPANMESDPRDPSMYSFHVYALFKFPYGTSSNGATRSFAETILEKNRSALRSDQAQFIESSINQNYRVLMVNNVVDSAYVNVTDIDSGEEFSLRDLGLASSGVRGMLLLSLVIKMWGNSYLLGAFPRILPGDWAGKIIALRDTVSKKAEGMSVPPGAANFLGSLTEDILKRGAFCRAVEIYDDVGESKRIVNMDAEPIEPRVIEYSLDIDPVSAWEILYKGTRQFQPVEADTTELVWYGGKMKRDLTGQPYIRGHVKLTPGKLVVEVNSEKRAEKLCKLIEKKLSGVVDFISEIKPEPQTEEVTQEANELPPEVAQAIQEKMNMYYEKWLDDSIPALGGMTPRQAAEDPKMKYALEALLLEFERKSSINPLDVISPDVNVLRAQLFKGMRQ